MLIFTFKINNDVIEIVKHDATLNYMFYKNGCITDVMFPRSIFNLKYSRSDMQSEIGIFNMRNEIVYGHSAYNKKYFMDYFNKFRDLFPEEFI